MSERLFGYTRVSGASQTDKDGPIRQREGIEKFARDTGAQIIHIFSETISGTVDGMNRPEFVLMLELAKEREVTGIVVENLDRLARDLIVSELLIQELKKRGLKLYAVHNGPVDQVSCEADPSRKLIRQIMTALAEYNKSMLVLKLSAAKQRIKLKQGFCDGKKPYGHSPEGKAILELIVNLRGSGMSWRGVAKALTDGEIKKRHGTMKWTADEARRFYVSAVNRTKKLLSRNCAADARPPIPESGAACQ